VLCFFLVYFISVQLFGTLYKHLYGMLSNQTISCPHWNSASIKVEDTTVQQWKGCIDSHDEHEKNNGPYAMPVLEPMLPAQAMKVEVRDW